MDSRKRCIDAIDAVATESRLHLLIPELGDVEVGGNSVAVGDEIWIMSLA